MTRRRKNALLLSIVLMLSMVFGLLGNGRTALGEERMPDDAAPVIESEGMLDEASEDPADAARKGESGRMVFGDISGELIQEGAFPEAEQKLGEDGQIAAEPAWDRKGAVRAIEEAIRDWDGGEYASASLGEYRVPAEEIPGLLRDVINDHPEFFYADGAYVSEADPEGFAEKLAVKVKDGITIEYTKAFDEKVDAILSAVDSGWTDLQKVMYIHDYLVTHVQYDLTYSKYDAESAIVGGSAVCEGYSLAFKYLINKLGNQFKCDYVGSNALNHAWNYLTVNNKQYYVDCTWDDPIAADDAGNATHWPEYNCRHANFLLSRQGMAGTKHNSTDWKDKAGNDIYHSVPGSTDYESAPWIEMDSPMPMVGNLGAYHTGMQEITLNTYDFKTQATKKLTDYNAKWYVWGKSSWWTANYSCLSSVGNYFTATTQNQVLLINAQTGEKKTVYTLNDSEQSKGYIYGGMVENGILKYQLYTSYSSGKKGEGTVDLSAYDSSKIRVVLDRDQLTLSKNETAKLTAEVLPEDTEDKRVVFSSSDESVATVDQDGNVKGEAEGDALITAVPMAGGRSASCMVTVEDKQYFTVTFRNKDITVYEELVVKGDTVKNIPEDPEGGSLFLGWYINNKTLWDPAFPVLENLVLEARFMEDTISSNTGSPLDTKIMAKKGDVLYLVKGQNYFLDPAYRWASSDPSIVGISKGSLVKGKKEAEGIEISGEPLSVSADKITCRVTVADPKLTKSLTLPVGETGKLELNLNGNEKHYNVAWYSDNPAVASVGEGMVAANGKGSTKVTAFVNGKQLKATVKVVEKETIKAIGKDTLILRPMQTISPKFADGYKLKGVKWTGLPELEEVRNKAKQVTAYQNQVVKVGRDNRITAVGPGMAVLVAANASGEEKKLKVKVLPPAERSYYLFTDKKKAVSIFGTKPAAMEWTSSAESIASMKKGKIVAGSEAGTATISGNYNPYGSKHGFDFTLKAYVQDPSFKLTGEGELTKVNRQGTVYLLKIKKGKPCRLEGKGISEPLLFKSSRNDVVFADESGVVYGRQAGQNGRVKKAKLTARIGGRNYTVKVEVSE